MKQKLMGYASLARPANLPTAASDIFAGIAIGLFAKDIDFFTYLQENTLAVLSLVVSSVLLYAGGVVFNDVFDANLDAVERPERAIPSGVISLKEAILWGTVLFLLGGYLSFSNGFVSGIIAVALIISIVSYNGIAKKDAFLGPLNMGICRGLNLFLGITILGSFTFTWILMVPVLYIYAITLISRGEVHGNNKNHLLLSGVLYAMVCVSIALFVWFKTDNIIVLLPFLGVFSFVIFKSLYRAFIENSPKNIKSAVITGVLSLVLMNACWMAGFSGVFAALLVLLFLPLSFLLKRIFAVT